MNYETAKKLKEAGFPQLPFRECSECAAKAGSPYLCGDCLKSRDSAFPRCPTLSELIESCGDELRLQSYWSENDLMWQADNSYNFYVREDQIGEVGSTPEEAVANLYIALHANKEKE